MHYGTRHELLDGVRGVFAEVTRYPNEILDPGASLEEDLGIDSVKLGEVFSVLRERYELPEELGIEPEQLQSIGGISEALYEFLGANGNAPASAAPTPPANGGGHAVATPAAPANSGGVTPSNGNGKLDPAELERGILEVFAEVTRYPEEILDPAANLEEDLGIDSVKLGEVFSVLRERYGLPEETGIEPEQLQSIGGISTALYEFLGSQAAPARSVATPPAAAAPSAPPEPAAASTPSNGGALTPTAPAAAAAPHNGNGKLDAAELGRGVLAVFAEVTRYPEEILDPAASLEEDLGIDSVKLGEVFSVLRERYDLPEEIGLEPEQLQSIGGISQALHGFLSARGGSPVVEPSNDAALRQPVAAPAVAASVVAEPSPVVAGSFAALTPAVKPFAGKVAVVTGSGRGLGKEIVTYLAELGATVVVNSFHSRPQGIETAEQIVAAGGEATHVWGSVANPEQLEKLWDEVEERHGAIDFFISNASNGMLAKLEDITVEHWEKAFRTNVVGLHQSALRAVRLMRKRGGGKIITLSSPASHGYVDYFGCMGTVKAAVESLTRSMAIEFAPDNIQVNCVSPGPVYGELLERWPDSERLIRQWEGNTAYDRLCEARDVAHFIAYLLSEPVKLFTGSVLVMDGGISSQGW